MYRSYAFDPQPKDWAQLDWPHGLRDTIVKSEQYLKDVIERSGIVSGRPGSTLQVYE